MPLGYPPFYPLKSASANKEDILCVDLNELLLGMLASSLRRDIHHIALKQLQHGLLHTFARDIARNGRIVAFAGDLVYLVDEDYPPFRQSHIIVSLLKQTGQDTLDILSDISCLSEYSRIHYGERHIKKLCYGLCEQGLSRARRTYHQDVRLFQLQILGVIQIMVYALVMVVDSH